MKILTAGLLVCYFKVFVLLVKCLISLFYKYDHWSDFKMRDDHPHSYIV